MEKHSHLFEQFCTFESLYNGYLLARKNKRYHKDVLKFSSNLAEELIDLSNQLIWHTYKVDGIKEFTEYYPKKRIITVMPFKNRVVNCAAYNTLFPIYRKSFYEHSYGSVPGKGQVRAADKLEYWLRLVRNKSGEWYILKMDITKFFFRVPLEVQLRELAKPIDDPEMMWFLETAIKCDGRPFGLPVDAKDVTECERIMGIGMQVGSLISQMTANVVLTPLDHFIKRVLQVPYYIRYMDDMVCIVNGKSEAREVLKYVADYLDTNLGLQLNSKTAIIPAERGVEFVGKKITADSVRMRKSTTLHMKRHLKWVMENYSEGKIPLDYALSVIRSYLGFMKHCKCGSFKAKVLEDFVLVRHADNAPNFDLEQEYY